MKVGYKSRPLIVIIQQTKLKKVQPGTRNTETQITITQKQQLMTS